MNIHEEEEEEASGGGFFFLHIHIASRRPNFLEIAIVLLAPILNRPISRSTCRFINRRNYKDDDTRYLYCDFFEKGIFSAKSFRRGL